MIRKLFLTGALLFSALSMYAQSTFSTRVQQSTDDAEEEAISGAMYLTSSDLELVFDSFVNDDQLIGMRFSGVQVPAGAKIVNAYLQFTVDELKANDPCNLKVFVENDQNPATYSSVSGSISGRTYVNDSVLWSPSTWVSVGDNGAAQRTPNLAPLVDSIVNGSNWTSGNAMAFMIAGTGTRTAESYDGSSADAPELVIQYTQSQTVQAGFPVTASNDDAEEEDGNGTMYNSSSDLELVFDSFVNDDQFIGMRFSNVSIPAGKKIKQAYIQFTVDELKSNDPSNLQIFAEDAANPASYSTVAFDISGRSYFNDSVSWNPASWSTVGNASSAQRTTDISRLVDSIRINGGWQNGDAMAFMIKGTGTRTAESYDGSAADAPQLVIEYEDQNYLLQVLHASDLEGGADAIDDAPAFAAIVDKLEDEFANSLTISSGDNYIPGPFYNASDEDPIEDSLRDILSDFYGVNLNALGTEKGRIDISLMNVIGFNASCIGNHEFDNGEGGFADVALASGNSSNLSWMGTQFPYLSSNLNFSSSFLNSSFIDAVKEDSTFITDLNNPGSARNTPKIAPATVIERGGEKIGVVGATTQRFEIITSSGNVTVKGNPGGNDINLLAGQIQPYIDSLTNMGVNKIIVVTHLQQFALEQQLVGLLDDVDIILAGGSDNILSDANDVLRPGDVSKGNYPFKTVNAQGDSALIVSTDGQYSYVGRLVVAFDGNGKLLPSTVSEKTSGIYATIPSVISNLYGGVNPFAVGTRGYFARRLTNAIKDIVVAKDGNTFGKTEVFLEGRRSEVRTQETNMGNLSADANLWMARQFDPTVAVSLKNGGGIRAEIGFIDQISGTLLPPQPNPIANKDSLEVSQLDIENTLRFNNGLTVVETTPGGLQALLNHGIANWDGVNTEGRMPQVGGIRFSFNPTAAAGSRIVNVALVDSLGFVKDSVVLNGSVHGDPTRTIKMVSLNFLVDNDGDGYPFSTETSNTVALDSSNVPVAGNADFTEVGSEQDALAEYLSTLHSVNPYGEAEKAPNLDLRIQALSLRSDSVFVVNNIGLTENNANVNLQIFPNPTAGLVNIQASSVIEKVEIINSVGTRVGSATGNGLQARISLAHLSGGYYLVKVTTKEGVQTSAIILRR